MIILSVVLGLAVLFFVVTLLVYRMAFYSPKKRKPVDPALLPPSEDFDYLRDTMKKLVEDITDTPTELCRIKAYDGASLVGRYYHAADGAPLVLFFHGYRSQAIHDCVGAFHAFHGMGFNILAVDERSHGESDGTVITFGIRERHDAKSWAEFAEARFGVPIFLCGLSMGAATVLMASDLDLPKSVVCIMADCPFSSPKDILVSVSHARHVPAFLSYPLLKLGAKIFGKFDLEEASAASSVANSALPILLIHGKTDTFVPYSHSEKIYAAAPSHIRFESFPNADHGMSYFSDSCRYEKLFAEFTSECLSGRNNG
ncbi:MAG: alpha/beta hydrolase [Clostridia bacterium]|nr:alpha/beta hydrolase [Clostridia bacterium]